MDEEELDIELEQKPLGELGGHPGGTGPHPEGADVIPAFSAENARALGTDARALQAQYDSEIAGLGVANPLTGKPFGSFQEFREYGKALQREQLKDEAEKTGKTVEELREERENRDYIARKRREDAQKAESREKAVQKNAFLRADLKSFVAAHPDVDIEKLEQNQKFRKFAGGRLYNEPLGDLYGDFCDIVADTERAAVEKVAGKQARGTGGGQGGGGVMLSTRQNAELDEWNREHPELKMTAKEFYER